MHTPIALAAAAVACGALPRAQTLLVLEGPAARVTEIAGPPDPALCFYPIGPVQSQHVLDGAFPCPLPGALPPPPELRGDVAADRLKDTTWATDGARIAEYAADGAPIHSFALPPGLGFGPLTGLGYDGATKTLWATDGARAVQLAPPSLPCTPPSIVAPPITLPPLGPTAAPATDVEPDPFTGTLWLCDAAGFVGNVSTSGALISSFDATPGRCDLSAPLLGLAVDPSLAGVLYATDGAKVANLDAATGLSGATSFAEPFPCFGLPGAAGYGLAFTLRPVRYGQGGGVIAPPEIGSRGQSILGTAALVITLSGAAPGATALLPFSLDPLCPAITFATVPLLIPPPGFALLAAQVSAGGTAERTVAIPPGAAPGLEAFYQWFVLPGGPAPAPDGPPLLSSGAGSMRLGFH